MNKAHLSMVCILIAAVVVSYHSVGDVDTQEDGMVIGEVIDITGYAMFGRTGAEHVESGRYRAEQGFPVGILEEDTGAVWVAVYRLPVPAAGLQTANRVLAPVMGTKVVAQGVKYQKEGVNLIRISAVSEY